MIMVVLDNGVYGSTANLPTYSSRVDLGRLAGAAGWTVRRAGTPEGLREAFAEARGMGGPLFLHVRIEPGNAVDVPKLLEDPVLIGRRFAEWLVGKR